MRRKLLVVLFLAQMPYMLDGRGLSCFRFVAVAIDFRATFAAISRINPPCPLLDSTGSNFRWVEIDGDLLLVFAVVIRVIGLTLAGLSMLAID